VTRDEIKALRHHAETRPLNGYVNYLYPGDVLFLLDAAERCARYEAALERLCNHIETALHMNAIETKVSVEYEVKLARAALANGGGGA
jgi:hypothetical protein